VTLNRIWRRVSDKSHRLSEPGQSDLTTVITVFCNRQDVCQFSIRLSYEIIYIIYLYTYLHRFDILLRLTALMGNDTSKLKDELGNSVEQVENMASPRFIKTHLPVPLLPEQLNNVKPKIVYVTRNPKDMCVSYYHYCKLIHGLHGSFEEFCDLFIQGKTPIGPIWDHILGFWEQKDEPNVLFIKYEDMKKVRARGSCRWLSI